eukprot:3398057-Rhodomonas_salina.1
MPSPSLSLRAQMFASPTSRPSAVAGGGISKMQQKQSRQAKPKGSKHNISNQVKMTSDIKYADKADALPNGDKQVLAVKPFRFDGSQCVWYTLVKTEKMYHAAVDMVQSLSNDAGMKFIDCRSGYMETMAITEITLDYGWEGDDDSDESTNVEWLMISSKVFFLKNIAKDHGGCWNAADSQ